MKHRMTTRRKALQASLAFASLGFIPPVTFCRTSIASMPRHSVERPGIGAIGLRYQGTVITEKAREYGDIVAVCDVDRHVREQARASFGSTPKIFENYVELLASKDVDVVLIGTPDHWHAKMVMDACRAGKDVYCEKPLTLTIDEGRKIRDVAASSKQVVQVGSWQRSDHRFRQAVEMVRAGRIGNCRQLKLCWAKMKSAARLNVFLFRGILTGIFGRGRQPMCPIWPSDLIIRFAGGWIIPADK
jgi:hypothetical protein